MLTALLIAVWFAVTFCVGYFARELSEIRFLGWPLSFYLAAQGALIIYVGIVWIYAWRMRALDKAFGVREESDE
jgi:putative solute:sodium symporter small subunit